MIEETPEAAGGVERVRAAGRGAPPWILDHVKHSRRTHGRIARWRAGSRRLGGLRRCHDLAYPIVEMGEGLRHFVTGGGDFPVAGAGLDDPPAGPILDYEPVGSPRQQCESRCHRLWCFGRTACLRAELDRKGCRTSAVPPRDRRCGRGRKSQQRCAPGTPNSPARWPTSSSARCSFWSDPAIAALNPGLKLSDARSSSCIASTAPARPSTLPTISRRSSRMA